MDAVPRTNQNIDVTNRFQWVECQLDALQKYPDLPMLRQVLRSLPDSLDDTYIRILCHFDGVYKKHAMRIL